MPQSNGGLAWSVACFVARARLEESEEEAELRGAGADKVWTEDGWKKPPGHKQSHWLSCSQDESRHAQYLEFAAGLPTPRIRGRGCNAGERAAWGALQQNRLSRGGFSP